jgi:hypothetical protein
MFERNTTRTKKRNGSSSSTTDENTFKTKTKPAAGEKHFTGQQRAIASSVS